MDVVITLVLAFAGTNIDDIFLLMLLFAQAEGREKQRAIHAGRYLGTGVLLAISILGAYGLQFVSGQHLRLLGLVPIGLGIKAWLDYRGKKDKPDEGESTEVRRIGLLTVALITVSAGGDNIGVYIPLFAGYGVPQLICVAVVFTVMTALWNWLGERLAGLPLIRQKIRQHKDWAVAVIFVVLGVYILFM